jgi:hypothetical protein
MNFVRARGDAPGAGEFPAAPPPAGAATPAAARPEDASVGREVAAFYAQLVETTGLGWSGTGEEDADAAPPSDAELGVVVLLPGERYAAPARPSLPLARAPPPRARAAISPDNIGYRLLKQAGWSEGTGIGAHEQGAVEPLAPAAQKGGRGLGFATAREARAARKTAAAAAAGTECFPPRHEARAAAAAPPPDEFADEPIDAKVRRVARALQAVADAEAEQRLAQFVYAEFRDGAPASATANQNPLLRPGGTRLAASNPLLQDRD